jgi:hypothetical protein
MLRTTTPATTVSIAAQGRARAGAGAGLSSRRVAPTVPLEERAARIPLVERRVAESVCW